MDIEVKNLSYKYDKNSPFEREAIKDISLTIERGTFTAIIGHTGSGKSTLLQHFNGLLLPTFGEVRIGEVTIHRKSKEKNIKHLRKDIGFVFQNPEHQLFEETVEKEVLFGLMNFGYDEATAIQKAHQALKLVGIEQALYKRSPFQLSGGQMKRVAIASVLALQPKVLILDEPGAGLDFQGRQQLMDLFSFLNKEKNMTIILVTHNMNDVSNYAEKMFVLSNGKLVVTGSPQEVFHDEGIVAKHKLKVPETVHFMNMFEEKFKENKSFQGLSLEDAAMHIFNCLQHKE
jgi:energy-coupling factor transport system ATP-binding protein